MFEKQFFVLPECHSLFLYHARPPAISSNAPNPFFFRLAFALPLGSIILFTPPTPVKLQTIDIIQTQDGIQSSDPRSTQLCIEAPR